MKNKVLKQSIERQKIDRQRALRVGKYIDCPFVLSDSPVEMEEGYIVSDRDTCEVFASFIFKNLSALPIKRLKIRLLCYLYQNIPYHNIDFTYSQEELTFGIISKNGVEMKLREGNKRTSINQSESFGSCVFIPIPESYFTKLEVMLMEVEYSNGTVEPLNVLVAGENKRYYELDDISKRLYTRSNIYISAEDKYPTRVMPQQGKKVWLCCCGNKNPNNTDVCELCGREKEWQVNSMTAEHIKEAKKRLEADPSAIAYHDKTRYSQNKYLENDAEVQKKIEQYNTAMQNIAEEERRKHKRQMMLIPKILAAVAIIYLLTFVLWLVVEFRDPIKDISEGAEEAFSYLTRTLKLKI